MISATTSQKIKNMSLVCALLVVTIHVEWPHDTISFTWLIDQFFKEGISRIAVPFFFVVSGFFLAMHMGDQGWYGMEVRKRIYSLLIPYVVWILIAIMLVVPISIGADLLAHRPLWTSTGFAKGCWLSTFGLDLREGPWHNGALWYVRCLFMFVILAPIFKWFVVKFKFMWLVVAFVLTLAHSSWHLFPTYLQRCFNLGFSLSGVFYFSTGIYLGLNNGVIVIRRRIAILCLIFGVGLLLVKTLCEINGINPFVSLLTISIPFMLCAVWWLMPSVKWSSDLTSCSFPLFLLHVPIRSFFVVLLKHTPINHTQFESTMTFVGAVVTSFGIALVLRRFFPRVNVFLFAGRGNS